MLKVLIVDDERLEREALRKILLSHSDKYVIMGEASSANDALVLIKNMLPDVIIMDEKMPGMSSSRATEFISKEFPKVTIVLLKEDRDSKAEDEALYLYKPIRPKSILSLFEKLEAKKESSSGTKELLDKLLHTIREEDFKQSKELVGAFLNSARTEHSSEGLQSFVNSFRDNLISIYEEKNITLPFSKDHFLLTSFEKAEVYLYEWIEDLFTKIIHLNKPEDRKQIQCALNYIEKHYLRGVTLEEVADHVHLSPHYLSRLFKKELNINFVNYVSERRMNFAKELLEKTDMPVINIALELSYQEPNYFSKVFKKSTGMTPSEYRRQVEDKGKHLLKRNYYIPNGKWYI